MTRWRLQDVDASAANLTGSNDLDADSAEDDGRWRYLSLSATIDPITIGPRDRRSSLIAGRRGGIARYRGGDDRVVDGPWHHPSPSITVIAIGFRRHDRRCR